MGTLVNTILKLVNLKFKAGLGNIFFPEGHTDLDEVCEGLKTVPFITVYGDMDWLVGTENGQRKQLDPRAD